MLGFRPEVKNIFFFFNLIKNFLIINNLYLYQVLYHHFNLKNYLMFLYFQAHINDIDLFSIFNKYDQLQDKESVK